MSEELFDVVFFGILQPGKDREVVMQNMAQLFKTEPAKLAPYFAGGRKVIKGGVTAGTAEKYRAALENVGLVSSLSLQMPHHPKRQLLLKIPGTALAPPKRRHRPQPIPVP